MTINAHKYFDSLTRDSPNPVLLQVFLFMLYQVLIISLFISVDHLGCDLRKSTFRPAHTARTYQPTPHSLISLNWLPQKKARDPQFLHMLWFYITLTGLHIHFALMFQLHFPKIEVGKHLQRILGQHMLFTNQTEAHTDLSLFLPPMSKGTFSRVMVCSLVIDRQLCF